MKLEDVFGAHAPDPRTPAEDPEYSNHLFGIEVELENASQLDQGRYWAVKEDNSLRNEGRELVLRVPLAGYDLRAALNEFESLVSGEPVSTGMRTSLHVHMDVRDMTVLQIAQLVVLYAAVESVIYSANGSKQRYTNIYCPGITSNDQANNLAKFVRAAKHGNRLRLHEAVIESQKYSGLNIKAIERFGSIEFRMHKGTADKAELSEFIKLLTVLKQKAIEYNSIDSIITDVLQYKNAYASTVFNTDCSDIYSMYYYNNICNAVYIADYITYSAALSSSADETFTNSTGSTREQVISVLEEFARLNSA